MNEHLLKQKLTPAAYEAIIKDLIFPDPDDDIDYWEIIPEYLLARCPLCGATYTGQVDTYSLHYWVRPEQGESIFNELAQTIGCNHFVLTHHFINLNGQLPTELKGQKDFWSELPYVHPFWLAEDIKSYGVMHALPICRPERGRFVSRYMVYAITYYSENPPEMYKRRGAAAPKVWTALIPSHLFADQRAIFDLRRWVRRGTLQWLNPQDPELSLQSGPVEAFPYADIKGHTEYRIYYPQLREFSS